MGAYNEPGIMDQNFVSSNHRRRGSIAVQAFMERGAGFSVNRRKGYLHLGDYKIRLAFSVFTKLFLEHLYWILYDERLDTSSEESRPEDGCKGIFEGNEIAQSTNESMWISKGVGIPLHCTNTVWELPTEPGYWRVRLAGDDPFLVSQWLSKLSENKFTYRCKGKRLYFSNTLSASLGIPPNAAHLGLLRYKLWKLPGHPYIHDDGLYATIKWKLTNAGTTECTRLLSAARLGTVSDRFDARLKRILGMGEEGRNLFAWFSSRE